MVILLAVAVAIFQFWIRDEEEVLSTVVVERGSLYREIFATGKAQAVEEFPLAFRSGGLVSEIFASEGERVARGKVLAELDTEELLRRLDQAKSALEAQETSLDASRVQARNARDHLLALIRDSYVKIEDVVFTRSDSFFGSGSFGVTIQEGATSHFFNTRDEELSLSLTREHRKLLSEVSEWRVRAINEDVFVEAQLAIARLQRTHEFLRKLALAVSDFSTERSSLIPMLDGYRGMVSAMRSLISGSLLGLESATQNLRAAESGINPALVSQSRAAIGVLETQISNARLIAPINGLVLKRHVAAGAVVQPGQAIFTLHPDRVLIVESEIYEGDIGEVVVGKRAELEFVAFPGSVFYGEVTAIEPTPILMDGVVHYRVRLRLIDPPRGILPSMSADVSFKVLLATDALLAPDVAIRRQDGESFVRVVVNDTYEDRAVVLGERGDNRMVEILKGLTEKEVILLQ